MQVTVQVNCIFFHDVVFLSEGFFLTIMKVGICVDQSAVSF